MLGERLKYHRTMLGITQTELAESAGLQRGALGTIESRSTDIHLSTAIKLKDALELHKVEDLLRPVTREERQEAYEVRKRREKYKHQRMLDKQNERRRRARELSKIR